jgi:tetratricopeptide (TPR) repeat protein
MNAIFAYLHLGQGNQAIHQTKELVSFTEMAFKGLLGHAYAIAGQNKMAMEILDELYELSEQSQIAAMQFALIHIGLGNLDEALSWLDKSHSEHGSPFIALIQTLPMFDPLRNDLRFEELIQKLNFTNLVK